MPDGDISLGSVKCNSIKTKWSTLLVESKVVCVVDRLELLEQKKAILRRRILSRMAILLRIT